MSEKISALRKIQLELKAPKSKYNEYGKFHYRSCEDILEAVKPLLDKYGCDMVITDDVNDIAGIAVITAKVVFKDADGNVTEVKAHAGVEAKKGMDISQTFGASSTYARKYALNGLFLIDDTKDADSDEYQQNMQSNQTQQRGNQNTQQNRQQNQQVSQNQTGSNNQRTEAGKPKRSLEEIYQSALTKIQKTNDPGVLDAAIGRFANTQYSHSIENACRARADQKGWARNNSSVNNPPPQQFRH